jgi:hypothetical protein
MTSAVRDPIVDDVRRIRDEIASAHGYDLKSIISTFQADQTKHGSLLVSRQPKKLGDEEPSSAPDTRRRLTQG